MALLLQWTAVQPLLQKKVTVGDIPYITQLLGSGKIRLNSEVRVSRNRVYIWPSTSVYTTDKLISKVQHPGIRSPAA
jgi:hypothetical protein